MIRYRKLQLVIGDTFNVVEHAKAVHGSVLQRVL
jgi:hypothetical protein